MLMAHVSKRKIKDTILRELFEQMAKVIARSGKRNSTAFLNEFLTDTEQIMHAKRLAVIVMLHEGYSTYRILNELGMSASTVTTMKGRFLDGQYETITRVYGRNKKQREELWQLIELISRAGLPSMGKKRWQNLKL